MNRSSNKRTTRQLPSAQQVRMAHVCASKVLRPLLRVLLAAGLNRQQLVEVCDKNVRGLTVDAVSAHIKSLPHCDPIERIVAHWVNHPTYLDRGEPMQLRINGKKPSFQSLLQSVAPQSSVTFVLHALERGRVVKVAGNGKVQLLSRFYPTRLHGAVDIELFTKMTIDFLRTLELNILKNPRIGHGLFQRIAHKRNSDASLAPVFNRYVRKQGQLFLETVDEWLVRHQPKRSRAGLRKRVRLGVGIYVINEALR